MTATVSIADVPRTATYTREYAKRHGFMTLISDGQRLTGAYALGPDAGEWLQQATLAVRAQVPLETMQDTIQPFPSFSEIFLYAFEELGEPPGRGVARTPCHSPPRRVASSGAFTAVTGGRGSSGSRQHREKPRL